MLKNKLFFIAAIILLSTFFIPAQNRHVASAVRTQYKINSQILNEERTILVRVPANYDRANKKFPEVLNETDIFHKIFSR